MQRQPGNYDWFFTDPPGRCPWVVDILGKPIPAQALCDLAYSTLAQAPAEWSGLFESVATLYACLADGEWARLPVVIGALLLDIGVNLEMSELTSVLADAATTTMSCGAQAGVTAIAHRIRVLCDS